MWFTNSTLDVDIDTDDWDVPVQKLRKTRIPPSRRGRQRPAQTQNQTQAAPTQNQPQAADAEASATPNFDPYGWAAIWLLVGWQLYAGAHFKYWVIASIVVVLITDVKYFIGAGALLGAMYFGFQYFFI